MSQAKGVLQNFNIIWTNQPSTFQETKNLLVFIMIPGKASVVSPELKASTN